MAFDSRQTEHRSSLPRLSDEAKPTLKQILPELDREITPVFELRESSTPDLILNVGTNKIQNTDTELTRAMSPISGKFFEFTSGTIEFPSTSGGTITVTPGDNSTLTVSSGNFIAVLVQIDSDGQLSVALGIEAASKALAESTANFPQVSGSKLPIGYVVLQNLGGTIQNVTNDNIVQFESGAGSGGGSGSGGKNYLGTGGDAENGIIGWEVYANTTPGSTPDDFGGTPVGVTFTTSSTTPLAGDNDFVLSKDANNRQGTGVYYEFTLDRIDFAKIIRFTAGYEVSANYADGDIRFFLVSSNDNFVADFDLIYGTADELLSSLITERKESVEFQTHISNTSYRFCIHIASTNASAYTVNLDEMVLGPNPKSYGSVVTDDINYTPVVAPGFGTITSATGSYYRVGSKMKGGGRFTTGTVAASAAYIEVPDGLACSVPYSGARVIVGRWAVSNSTEANAGYLILNTDNNNQRIFFGQPENLSAGGQDPTNATLTLCDDVAGNTEVISFEFEVPILGWGSSLILSDDADTRVTTAIYQRSSVFPLPTGVFTLIPFDVKLKDTHGAVSGGVFTAPSAGYYECSAAIRVEKSVGNWLVPNQVELSVFVNGFDRGNIALQQANAADQYAMGLNGTRVVYAETGQTIDFRVFQNGGADVETGSTTQCNMSIVKISGPSQIAGSEKVIVSYRSDAGQLIPNNTPTIVIYEDKIIDTHDLYNPLTGQFTSPVSARYYISGSFGFPTASFGSGDEVQLRVTKNGGSTIFTPMNLQITGAMGGPSNYFSVHGGAVIFVAKGETLEISAFQVSGAGVNLTTDLVANFISIYKI